MLLTDLLHVCTSVFRPPPAPKAAARPVLVVPRHEFADKPEMSPVLAVAAAQLAASGLLWKWVSTDGTPKLCSWDSSQLVFARGSVQDWQIFIGQNWRMRDTNNVEFAGPSPLVADRLIAGALAHPETPINSWALQLRRKREAAR